MNNNKKVGCVIAFTKNHNNYGTSLQGYAMIKTIQKFGYECEIIRYEKQLTLFDKLGLVINMFRVKEKSKLKGIKNKVNQILYKQYRLGIKDRTKAVNSYKLTKLEPLFKVYSGYDSLHKGSLNYRAVIVGSDQVWTPMSLYSKYFNLLFVDENVPKIAYASSFGVSTIPDFQKKQTKEYLDRFYRIGVREIKGKEIVENLSVQKATVVADPTLLLTREEWLEEISTSTVNVGKDPYIFCYFLGANQDTRKAVEELKLKTGYKVVVIRHMDEYVASDENFGDYAPYDICPNDFLRLIESAEYVCTDSFHCTIFSIIFHRKFLTFYRYNSNSKNSRNSRIDSLFSLFNLQNRLYSKECNVFKLMDNNIDFKTVDVKLQMLRNESLNFLNSSISSVDSIQNHNS